MQDSVKRAALVSIGDELLRGDTVDTNKAFLARELTARGVSVEFGLTLPDVQCVIVRELRALLPLFDVVFTGGGIGPTTDDLTREAVAETFGRELVLYPEAEERYSRFIGRPLNAGQRAMCTLPAGCELIWSEQCAAPAFRTGNVYTLPGVPKIMQLMWFEIAPRFEGRPWHSVRFRAACGESTFAPVMRDFVQRYPHLGFGSYPKLDDSGWWAQILVRGRNAAEVERVACEFESGIAQAAQAGKNA
jgi:molybdenum cofactor synthesis domain-containing protein